MSNLFLLKENAEYLNMTGQIVSGRKGSIVVMPRRSDVKKHLKSGVMEPADGATRQTHTMTTINIMQGNETAPKPFEVGDFVGFLHEKKEVSGEIKKISSKGVLDVDIGTEDNTKVVRVRPDAVDVECLV